MYVFFKLGDLYGLFCQHQDPLTDAKMKRGKVTYSRLYNQLALELAPEPLQSPNSFLFSLNWASLSFLHPSHPYPKHSNKKSESESLIFKIGVLGGKLNLFKMLIVALHLLWIFRCQITSPIRTIRYFILWCEQTNSLMFHPPPKWQRGC